MRHVATWILIAVCVGVGVYVGFRQSAAQSELNKANHLKDEGNAAGAAGDKIVEEIKDKFTTLFSGPTLSGFPGNRADNEAAAKETAEQYQKAVEQYRLAAAKFDEASKRSIDQAVAEYFGVWSQVHAKTADRRATAREYVLLWLDPETDTQEKMTAKMNEIEKRFDAVSTEVDALVAKAKQMEKDYADKLD